MMEYGQSSGMVNVDGTMMPDPSKHPELEAMVSADGRKLALGSENLGGRMGRKRDVLS